MFLHLKKAFYQRIMIFHFGRVQSCCTAREESFIKKGKKSVGITDRTKVTVRLNCRSQVQNGSLY